MRYKKTIFLIVFSFVILFFAFSYNYLSSNLWDYDFWWHIATGRHIVENGSIPQTDPFSYTSGLEENKNLHPERESFILKQYWLAQVILYSIYEAAGSKGIIIFRGVMITLVIFIVLWGLYRRGVRFYISYIFTFLAYLGTRGFSGERPVLFTLFFTAVAFLLLDDYRVNKGRRLWLLLPLMLLWANIHGGFVLGCAIIAVYIAGESLKIFFKRSAYSGEEIRRFYLITFSAIAVSFINPNGLTAFFITFSPKYNIFTQGVQEYAPPFLLYMNRLMSPEYGYIAMVALLPVILALRGKRMDLTHVILLLGLCYASLTSLRFTAYYIIIGSIILGSELNSLTEGLFSSRLSQEWRRRLEAVFIAFVLLSSIGYLAAVKFGRFGFKEAVFFSVPKGGVDFIEKNRLRGRIFNDFGSGGYLTWRLYPFHKTFIDTRALNYILLREYVFIANAYYSKTSVEEPEDKKDIKGKSQLWERLLDHYNINLIFLTPLDVYGYIPRLVFKLAESDKWVPVYNDALSIIFVRNSEFNKKIIERFRRARDDIFDTVILQASLRAHGSKENPIYLVSLGETFHKMGRLEDALKAYKYALKRMPNPNVQEKIKQIESEIKTKEKEKTRDLPDKKRLKGKNIEKTKKT